jgi:hypothetical protein
MASRLSRLSPSVAAVLALSSLAVVQAQPVQINWSDGWNDIYHQFRDLDGDGDFDSPGDVSFHVDPAAAASAQPASLRVVDEGGVAVTYMLFKNGAIFGRGVDANGDGVLVDSEIATYRDSGALDGSSIPLDMDITDDGALWWTSGISSSQPVNGLLRIEDSDGDGVADGINDQVLMADGNGLHSFEHDLGTATFEPWNMGSIAAAGDGVMAHSTGDDYCVFLFEDLNGDGDVTDPDESILLLNATGERLDLPQNPDFVDGTLRTLETPSYPTRLSHLTTTFEDGGRVYYLGTGASPYVASGTNINGDGLNFLIFRGLDKNGDRDINDAGEVELYFDGSHTSGNPDLQLLRGLDALDDGTLYAVGLQPYPALFPGPDGNTWIHRFEILDGDGDALDPGEQQLEIFDAQEVGPGPFFPIPPLHGNMMSDPNDFSVIELSPWTDLGGGILGAAGVPTLTGTGTLEPNTVAVIDLVNTQPSTPMLFWVSFSSSPISIFGGTLHATPWDMQVPVNASAAGTLSLPTVWPVGIPSGTNAWLQFLCKDTTLTPKMTFSNGLKLTTP